MKENRISKSVSQWTSELEALGFDQITFPILIVDSPDLNLVYSLTDFASDSDLFHWEFEKNFELVDSGGSLWTWKYDYENKTNLPGSFRRTLTLNEVSDIILKYFHGSKQQQPVKEIIETTTSVKDLFERIADKF